MDPWDWPQAGPLEGTPAGPGAPPVDAGPTAGEAAGLVLAQVVGGGLGVAVDLGGWGAVGFGVPLMGVTLATAAALARGARRPGWLRRPRLKGLAARSAVGLGLLVALLVPLPPGGRAGLGLGAALGGLVLTLVVGDAVARLLDPMPEVGRASAGGPAGPWRRR